MSAPTARPHPSPRKPGAGTPAAAAAAAQPATRRQVAPERVTGAQSVVRALEELDVDTVFGIPGGAILPVYDPIFDSERVRLLYDVYHMQVMEGDLIRTIQEHHDAFAHYHVAGNPGRHEPDRSQEISYPAIYEAIVATGFDGYVGMEYLPRGGPVESLRAALDDLRAVTG